MEQRAAGVPTDRRAVVATAAGKNTESESESEKPVRPAKRTERAVPPLPTVDANPAVASTQYAHYRSQLSQDRTGLSEHRTALSEYCSDLSTHRTRLSTQRTEISMRRTGMSFQRTRLSADRTLASVIRTSLSLISFGFTISQVLTRLLTNLQKEVRPAHNFGLALVALGIGMLAIGIVYHCYFMLGLRHERKKMAAEGLIHAESKFPPSMTLITALLLLGIGITAIISMTFKVGPFH